MTQEIKRSDKDNEKLDELIGEVLSLNPGFANKIEENAKNNINGLILLCSTNERFHQYRSILLEIEQVIKEEYPEDG